MPSKQEMGRHQQKHFAGVLLLQFRHLRRPRQVAIPRLNQGAKVSEGFKQQGSYRVNGTGTDSYLLTVIEVRSAPHRLFSTSTGRRE